MKSNLFLLKWQESRQEAFEDIINDLKKFENYSVKEFRSVLEGRLTVLKEEIEKTKAL